MKRTSKLILILVLAIIMVMMVSTFAFAAENNATPNPFNPGTYTGDSEADVSQIGTIGNGIIRVVTTIGSVVSVIILIVLGIKYMMGSAEEKAEYKKTMIPYIIGAILIFAASGIATIVFNFASTITA